MIDGSIDVDLNGLISIQFNLKEKLIEEPVRMSKIFGNWSQYKKE